MPALARVPEIAGNIDLVEGSLAQSTEVVTEAGWIRLTPKNHAVRGIDENAVAESGQAVECPYVSASVLLDGADIPLFGLIQEIPWEEVRMGLRVEAVWADELKPSMEAIRYFKPVGEA